MNFSKMTPVLAICIASLACGGEPAFEPADAGEAPAAEGESSDRTYELRGVIVESDPMANTIKVDHEAIGDWMGAMTMTFPVRGADVQDLPEAGESVTATVHVDGTEYWISDVEAAMMEEAAEPAEGEESEDASEGEEAAE